MSQSHPLSFAPVSLEDIPTLAQIHHDAFATNILIHLMYGDDSDSGLVSDLQNTLQTDQTARLTKAIDNKTGEIIGWSMWNSYLDKETLTAALKAAEDRLTSPPKNSICPDLYLDLKRAVIAKRKLWIMERSTSVLNILVVRPQDQGKGVGKALVLAGLEEARRKGLQAWLEASTEGYALYRRCGFRDAGDPIEMDMAKYGHDAKT
ncbi:hypothetical protein FE257_011372 [Aspergillus nanangensis]|uniref:N-acetyltransferase domain-containing protein n=1 Tax=Aspergillus nanangensis TaxID=2582783 RepID=A0AAD4GRE9_ASPNN|nr:hypothetical protein FE257_011372 [Aspergillus nanangensis]